MSVSFLPYTLSHPFPYTHTQHTYTHELQSQLHDLKEAQSTDGSQLHRRLIDPAVNIVYERMKTQLKDYKEKLEQAQSDLSAWKFTPDRSAQSVPQTNSNSTRYSVDVCCCTCENCLCVTCYRIFLLHVHGFNSQSPHFTAYHVMHVTIKILVSCLMCMSTVL